MLQGDSKIQVLDETLRCPLGDHLIDLGSQ